MDNLSLIPPASIAVPRECEIVKIQLEGDYPGWARLYVPVGRSERGIIYLHGIQSHGGWFTASCDYLRRHGALVLAVDRRGSGLNRQERGHAHAPAQLLGDLDRTAEWLRETSGFAKVDLLAVSWSGKLALVYAAQHPEKVASLTLVAPGFCPMVDLSLPEKIRVGMNGALHPHKLHPIPLDDPALFTANPEKQAFIRDDPLKLTETTAAFLITSRRLDSMCPHAIAKLSQRKIPIRLFLAGRDFIIDNQATIRLLGPILTAAPVIYPDAGHTLEFKPDFEKFFHDLSSFENLAADCADKRR